MSEVSRTDRAEALLARIDAATEAELKRLRTEAEADAAALLKSAHAKARRRVHTEIAAQRRHRTDTLRHETARLDTARRHLRQREAGAIVAAGLKSLEVALGALWKHASTRRAWAAAAVASAASRLFPGEWVVEHPRNWPEGEKRALADDVVARTGKVPAFRDNPDLRAGLRIRVDGVCLDASAAALIGNTEEAGAALLAEVARDGEAGQ